MKRQFLAGLTIIIILLSCNRGSNEPTSKISIVTEAAKNRTDIFIDGKLFTSFIWPENVYKPVLYPVMTSSGTEITRGFPLKPRFGEQVDHIHQVGIWLNYGNVNGIDFWGNGHRGVPEPDGGVIKHESIDRIESKGGEGSFVSTENWTGPNGRIILKEKSEYHFIADGTTRIIDRITTLTATESSVTFSDTKEGMFAIRVARQLEMPSKKGVILIDSNGRPSTEKDTLNTGVSGNYLSSEGLTGEKVWGTRAKWMELNGIIGNENISIVICDHPKNTGYPTYWHARGYGLFAANPLGWKDFTDGKEKLNLTVEPKKTIKFRYRVIISSGKHLTGSEINTYSEKFAKKYKR